MNKKEEILQELKKIAFELAKQYNSNIKIEINTNTKYESAKINITEFNK